MLSKVGHQNQAETISHILVQKAKIYFNAGEFAKCTEDLEDAFRFAPSVSAKIMSLKLHLHNGALDHSKSLLLELLKEHPMYASFIFESLAEPLKTGTDEEKNNFSKRFALIKEYFLAMDDKELLSSASVILSKVRLLKTSGNADLAYSLLNEWMNNEVKPNEAMKAEYITLLIELGKKDEALGEVKGLLANLHQSLTKHYCKSCGYNSDDIFGDVHSVMNGKLFSLDGKYNEKDFLNFVVLCIHY